MLRVSALRCSAKHEIEVALFIKGLYKINKSMPAWDFHFRLFDMLRVSALRWSAKHGIEVALFIKSCEQNAHEPIFYGIKNKFKKFFKKML